ncbi:MAG: ROK family protein [Halobacteriales archaeon]
MPTVGGVDLGATNLRAAVAVGRDGPDGVERRPTPQGDDGEAVAASVTDALADASAMAGLDPGELTAVGVGTIGPLDRDAGAVVEPPNLAGVERMPLRDELATFVGRDRVYVENDAVAGLVGERSARAHPPADLVYLTLSTGIGAGVAVDGHVLRGRRGNAAEVGHLVVDPAGRRTCGCGRPGHWEAYCAGAAIPGLARDLASGGSRGTDLDLDDPALSAADVLGAAGDDPLADRVVERVRGYNAIGLANVVHAYAPDRIAVGGAVALENRSLLVDPMAGAVAEHAILDVPAIEPAVHGHDAVLRGALALARSGGIDSRP